MQTQIRMVCAKKVYSTPKDILIAPNPDGKISMIVSCDEDNCPQKESLKCVAKDMIVEIKGV